MAFLLRTLLCSAFGQSPKLICDQQLWNDGADELQRRTEGIHESGAFLLGSVRGSVRRVRQFIFYDDIDPDCFAHGIVEFDGTKFGIVWDKCRELSVSVVADVHVHPGGYGHSRSDCSNPMIPEAGHIGLFLPYFAARSRLPGAIGIYEYLGARRWRDHSFRGDRAFHVGWWPR
jgi:hypothetical protein